MSERGTNRRAAGAETRKAERAAASAAAREAVQAALRGTSLTLALLLGASAIAAVPAASAAAAAPANAAAAAGEALAAMAAAATPTAKASPVRLASASVLDDVVRDAAWALAAVAELTQRGIFTGYPDGTFRPNGSISRVETIAAAVRLMGLDGEAQSDRARRAKLSAADAELIQRDHAWAVGYIRVAEQQKLLDDAKAELKPGEAADRLWTTKVLLRALGLAKEAEAAAGSTLPFRDASGVDEASVGYVFAAAERGLVAGYPDGTFKPGRAVTRAELAALLDRAGDRLPQTGTEYPEIGATVAGIVGSQLTLRQGTASQTFGIAPTATIVREGQLAPPSALQPGDELRAVIHQNRVVHLTVTKAVAAPEGERTGMIVSLLAAQQGVVSLETDSGVLELKLAADAILTRDGKPAGLIDLQEGDDATVMLRGGSVTRLDAVAGNRYNGRITGFVTAIDGKEVTIRTMDEQTITLPMRSDVTILVNRDPGSWSKVRTGSEVTAVAAQGFVYHMTVTAHADEAVSDKITGIISSVYPNQIMLSRDGVQEVYTFHREAAVTREYKAITPNELRPGDEIFIVMRDSRAWVVTVTKAAAELPPFLTDAVYYNHVGRSNRMTELTIVQTQGVDKIFHTFPVSPDVMIVGELREAYANVTKLDLILREGVVTAIVLKQSGAQHNSPN